MVVHKIKNLSDDLKARVGLLALIFSALIMGLAAVLFLSSAKSFEGLDLGPDAGTYGWYMMVLGLLLATVGLIFSVLIPDNEN